MANAQQGSEEYMWNEYILTAPPKTSWGNMLLCVRTVKRREFVSRTLAYNSHCGSSSCGKK